MTDKRKLVELLRDGLERWQFDMNFGRSDFADHLLANGVVVREKGEWLDNVDENGFLCNAWRKCSACGGLNFSKRPPFCPNCGADMRKGENG